MDTDEYSKVYSEVRAFFFFLFPFPSFPPLTPRRNLEKKRKIAKEILEKRQKKKEKKKLIIEKIVCYLRTIYRRL